MDEDLVRAWCAARRIPLCVGTGDVAAYAGENGLTIEEAARKLRYDFLNSVAGQTGAARIVTAHHANDNAETVLFHLARGTGMAGLAGIAPKNGRLVRPFLCLTREELAAYAKEHHVPYRTDATNADTALTRNFIRAEVLPKLCRVNAQAVEHISETALRLRQEDVTLQGHAIECRINSEDARNNFRPSCGQIKFMHIPGGPWVRFDTAIYQDYVIPPYYDSMIGKLIVYARERTEAIRKMQAALCELVIDGVHTNVELSGDILAQPEFKDGTYCTNFLEKFLKNYK